MRHLVLTLSVVAPLLLVPVGAARAGDAVPLCQEGEIPWFTAAPELPELIGAAPAGRVAGDDGDAPFRCRGDLLLSDARCWPDVPAGSVPRSVPLLGGSDQFLAADQDPPPLRAATRLPFLREAARATHPGYARGLERPPRVSSI